MELAHTLRELWRLRIGVAIILLLAILAGVGTSFRIQLSPPSLEPKSYEFGAATTSMMVDSTKSPVVNLGPFFEPLVGRAGVYSRLMTSAPVREYIGREIGVPGEEIVAEGPPDGTVTRAEREPTPGERANALRNEGKFYRLDFRAQEDLPIVTVNAQARTADEAAALADAAVTGFQKYAAELETEQLVPPRKKIILRQLGEAQGGTVNAGTSKLVALLAFVAAFGVGIVALLVGSNVVRTWRAAAWQEQDVSVEEEEWLVVPQDPENDGNGAGSVVFAADAERDDDRLSSRA